MWAYILLPVALGAFLGWALEGWRGAVIYSFLTLALTVASHLWLYESYLLD